MTTTNRKYYVMVPAAVSHDGSPYWQELLEVKTLTSAQHYVSQLFSGFTEAAIWMTRDHGVMQEVSKKNAEGKWKIIYKRKADADEQPNNHYHLRGLRFSRADFYKYGFQHEKSGRNKNVRELLHRTTQISNY